MNYFKRTKILLLIIFLICSTVAIAQTPVIRPLPALKKPTTSIQNTEDRFKIKGTGTTTIASIVTADFYATIYNSQNTTIDLTANSITFNKAGLYRLEFGAMGNITSKASAGIIATLIINGNSAEYVEFAPAIKTDATYSSSIKFTTDRYFAAGTSLKISLDGGMPIGDLYLAGYLISE